MAYILDLPDEMLIRITFYLRQEDRFRFLLCSNRLKKVSQPLLYKTVTLSRWSILILVRSLRNQPPLRLLIESIHLDDTIDDNYLANAKVAVDDIKDDDLTPLPRTMGGLDQLRADLHSYQGGAWLALLIVHLDNLTQLELHFRHSPEHVIALLRATASEDWKHSRFFKLRAIRFWMDKEVLLDLGPVLQLPALQTLKIKNLLLLHKEAVLQTCKLLDLNVKHLKDPIMSPRVALGLLRACGNLQRCTLFLAGKNGAGYWVTAVFNCGFGFWTHTK